MEQIVDNLSDISWWFTGLFFVLCGILLSKFNLIFIVYKLNYNERKFFRWIQLSALKNIKKHRQHSSRVQWAISKYHSVNTVFNVFLLLIAVVYSVTPTDLELSPSQSNLVIFILLSIGFVFYYVQLLKFHTQAIVDKHIDWKKRIKKRSS